MDPNLFASIVVLFPWVDDVVLTISFHEGASRSYPPETSLNVGGAATYDIVSANMKTTRMSSSLLQPIHVEPQNIAHFSQIARELYHVLMHPRIFVPPSGPSKYDQDHPPYNPKP